MTRKYHEKLLGIADDFSPKELLEEILASNSEKENEAIYKHIRQVWELDLVEDED